MSEPVDPKMALIALVNQIKEIEIGDFKVKIRPLTWSQEANIAAVVGRKIKEGVPQEVADREYMKLTVLSGLIEPKLTEQEVENLKVGVVVALSKEIGMISGGLQKK